MTITHEGRAKVMSVDMKNYWCVVRVLSGDCHGREYNLRPSQVSGGLKSALRKRRGRFCFVNSASYSLPYFTPFT